MLENGGLIFYLAGILGPGYFVFALPPPPVPGEGGLETKGLVMAVPVADEGP